MSIYLSIYLSVDLYILLFHCPYYTVNIAVDYVCISLLYYVLRHILLHLYLLCTYCGERGREKQAYSIVTFVCTITLPLILWMGLPSDDANWSRVSLLEKIYHCVCVCVCVWKVTDPCNRSQWVEAEVKICMLSWK